MAGVVKVFVESDTGSLIERRAGQVQRVVLRQLQREEDLSISASPDVADNEQLAKVEMSFGGFPKSVERKTLDSDLLYFEFPFGPKEVTYGETGHFETIEVIFNKDSINYNDLLNHFWKNIDPFDEYGQFCDKGYSYRSVAFYENEEQKYLIEKV